MRLEHWFYTIPLRLRSLLRRQRVEPELDEELQYHLQRKTEENLGAGMAAEEATRAASTCCKTPCKICAMPRERFCEIQASRWLRFSRLPLELARTLPFSLLFIRPCSSLFLFTIPSSSSSCAKLRPRRETIPSQEKTISTGARGTRPSAT